MLLNGPASTGEIQSSGHYLKATVQKGQFWTPVEYEQRIQQK